MSWVRLEITIKKLVRLLFSRMQFMKRAYVLFEMLRMPSTTSSGRNLY